MSNAGKLFYMSKIAYKPSTPIEMFKEIIGKLETQLFVMNLATVDKQFGVLSRSVIYRGLTSDEDTSHIRFVTEKNSHKYQNLKQNPKVSVTMVFNLPEELWQIRLFNAEAVELQDKALKNLWLEEPIYAKIRSVICKCGKPNEGVEGLEDKYQEIFERYEKEGYEPEQTESYTAFKIIPKQWDFYYSQPNKIADRIQYKLICNETNKWETYHVDA